MSEPELYQKIERLYGAIAAIELRLYAEAAGTYGDTCTMKTFMKDVNKLEAVAGELLEDRQQATRKEKHDRY